ncbi:hypothetical protein GLU60_03685 [Nanohaloarchaea archaeon H01]|nr:hypothetical protein [Nanohaloarchaea archaeon H01]
MEIHLRKSGLKSLWRL